MPTSSRRRFRRGWRLTFVCALVVGCGGEPEPSASRPVPDVDSVAFGTVEEVQAELETLEYEIADLEAFLAHDTLAARTPRDVDPRPLLDHARRAREVAQSRVAAGDLEEASDSLTAAAGHIEQVKRALGLAEEWGEDF